LATTLQVPALSKVIVDPLVPLGEQTVGVVVVKVTGKFELAVADTVTGDWAVVLLARAAKVMVCAVSEMVKLWVTAGAGA
jgi:hypothetical protein